MRSLIIIALFLFISSSTRESEKLVNDNESKVSFTTTDSILQKTFDRAEFLAKENIIDYGARKVMIEGAQYTSIWLETQPIGGVMYGNRLWRLHKTTLKYLSITKGKMDDFQV